MKDVNLRASAKLGLIWGVAFTLGRDLIQFLAMLIMVRLLSPAIYGQQALAQTIIGFVAVASLKTVAQYPLQARDPETFDWDAHFTAGATINVLAFVLTIAVGSLMLRVGDGLNTIGLLVLMMSPIFIIEIAGTYHLGWLQAHHRWQRMRTLLLAGSISASLLGVVLAWLGWGAFALASTTMFLAIPPALDLMLFAERRPRFALSRLMDYADGARFGVNRAMSSIASAGRGLAESSVVTGYFGFSSLGAFSRAIGLAQITSGRIGPVAVEALYSVLTRAEAASDRFRRFAALLLQGVTWLSVPAAAFLAVESHATVSLLYGARWESTIPLLPLAAILIALRGISATLNQTMLANLQVGDCLKVDVGTAIAGLTTIGVAVPLGVTGYLVALIICQTFVLATTIHLAVRGGAIALRALVDLSAPCLAATATACVLTAALPPTTFGLEPLWPSLLLHLGVHGVIFATVYLAVLRICAPQAAITMLAALPIPAPLRRVILLLLPVPAAGR